MSDCSGSRDLQKSVPQAVESVEVDDIEISCAENKIMYIYPQDDGFLLVRSEPSDTGENPASRPSQMSLPQFLKVLVNGEKSCKGNRYYFEILEGPLVNPAQDWDVRDPINRWSVSKEYNGVSTLVEENPHLPPFALEVDYLEMSPRNDTADGEVDGIRKAIAHNPPEVAVASVKGRMTFNGQATDVVMELDIIPPNRPFNVAIPDTVHDGGRRYKSDVPKAMLWMRIDARTSPVAWRNGAVGNDRYLHYGRGSAGCFTNLPDTSTQWNAIIDDLSRSRLSTNGIYAGTIQFNISDEEYVSIETKLRAYATKHSLPYIWNNQLITP